MEIVVEEHKFLKILVEEYKILDIWVELFKFMKILVKEWLAYEIVSWVVAIHEIDLIQSYFQAFMTPFPFIIEFLLKKLATALFL